MFAARLAAIRRIADQRGPLSAADIAALEAFINTGPPRGDIEIYTAYKQAVERIALRLCRELRGTQRTMF